MSKKMNRIDSFLKYIRNIIIQNKNVDISKNNIYGELTRLSLPKKEKKKQIDNFFNEWINAFKDNENCYTFVDPDWNYFCQFISKDNTAKNSLDHLKVYIPLDSNHIELGAKQIFNFLSAKKIPHLSKIGSHVRFDDIVVRLVNPNDVKELIEFINNNKYLKEGLLKSNPFAFQYNGIALAVDGILSYNETVAKLIHLYMNNAKKTNTLNKVNVNDFYKFIESYYNYVFSSKEGLMTLENDFQNNEIKFNADKFVNYKNIFELILKSRDKSFTFEDYVNHYNECINQEKIKEKSQKIKKLLNNELNENEINTMLLYTIDRMVEKYHNQYEVLQNINNYLLSGNERFITRDFNLRNIIHKSNFRNTLNQIIKNKQISFIDYANNLLKNRQATNQEESLYEIEKNILITTKEIIQIMTKKYGYDTAIENLKAYINNGNPCLLTRDFNLRNRIASSKYRESFINILNKRKINIQNYLNTITESINNDINNENELYFEQAILETYYKYEMKYQNNESDCDGKTFVIDAIINLINNNNYNGFTRTNNARQNLENNLTPKNILNFIKKRNNIEDDTIITNKSLEILVEQYVETIIGNNTNKKYR